MKIIDAVLGFFKPTVVEKEREVKVVRLESVIVRMLICAVTSLLKMSQ